MAKNDYSEDAQTALELIDEFGDSEAKLIEPSGLPVDPNKLWLGNTVDPTPHNTVIALDTLTMQEKKYLPDSLAVKTVKRAYMEDVILDIAPENGWIIIHNNTEWTIETIADLEPNNVNVYYDMIVSK